MSSKKILEVPIPFKELAPAIILVVNSIIWFTLILVLFSNSIQNLGLPMIETLVLHGMYYAGIALSAFLGAFLFPRARDNYLVLWISFGTIMTALLATIQSNVLPANLFVSLLLGISIGLGLPSTLAYFADTTVVENRGTYGGLTWCVVGFGTLALAAAVIYLGPFLAVIVLTMWRATGIVLFFALSRRRGRLQLPSHVHSYRSILLRRDVALYLVPWVMFSLVNFAESPILASVFGGLHDLIGFIEFAISGVFAAVSGMLADTIGRKRVVIAGFVILGIEYAILSLFSGVQASWYVYTLCDGIAWGIFASVFFMTLWGDLSETGQKEKYYVLGGLPYLLAGFLPVILEPFVTGIETATAFSLASFFLFLAVLPLVYAPETLPEKKIKERELRDYVEKAEKMKDKYS